MVVQEQQQQAQRQQGATVIPPKDKKSKKRQKAATAAAAAQRETVEQATRQQTVTQAAGSITNSGNKKEKKKKKKRKPLLVDTPSSGTRSAVRLRAQSSDNGAMQGNTEMYGEELPLPPTPKQKPPKKSASVKVKRYEEWKQKTGNADTTTSNNGNGMQEDGEVDELDGLFFVDTAPAKVHKDVEPLEKPVISRRLRSASPSIVKVSIPRSSRSRSPVLSLLTEEKVVPDYVGSSSEIKEVDMVRDDGVVQGSSKDLLAATVAQHSKASTQSNGRNNTSTTEAPSQQAAAVLGTDSLTNHTSPGGTKRKREDDTALPAEKKVSTGNGMVLGDLSTDESSSSDDELSKISIKDVDTRHDDSHSDGESSGSDDNDKTDHLDLNMEVETNRARAPQPPPQLAMEIDLTGSPVPGDASTEASAQAREDSTRKLQSTESGQKQDVSGGNNVAEAKRETADIDLEGVEDDEYQADRSRYFKEDDPLKVCARCGESGHTVRDCVHLQCLTCGKLDDHGTRSCPLTMTCFRCNSRGHHIKDCPLSPEEARNGANQFCERCSSHTHKSSTCPYIWRVYIRAADAPMKPPKIHFACYNCASGDHFGDDCKYPRGHPIMNTERTAFTMDPDNHRKTHIRFDASSSALPRPGAVSEKKDVGPPPSHAPRGPRAMQRKANTEEKKKPQVKDTRASLEDVLYRLEQDRQKKGDFGNLGDLEAGEIDEDEDAFEKRLQENKEEPKQPRGPRPGARDRRKAREGVFKINTDSSVAGEPEPRRTFQPIRTIEDVPVPDDHPLKRLRSLSRSPPPPSRRREGRQPSPIAMDSPAQAKSAESWKKNKGLQGRLQGGGSGKDSGRGGFASGSLLDRIDRGSASSARNAPAFRDPRSYDRREHGRDDYDDHQRDPRGGRRGLDSYVPDSEPRGGNPRYRGGYF